MEIQIVRRTMLSSLQNTGLFFIASHFIYLLFLFLYVMISILYWKIYSFYVYVHLLIFNYLVNYTFINAFINLMLLISN